MVRSSCCVSPSAWVFTADVMAFNCSCGVARSIELHNANSFRPEEVFRVIFRVTQSIAEKSNGITPFQPQRQAFIGRAKEHSRRQPLQRHFVAVARRRAQWSFHSCTRNPQHSGCTDQNTHAPPPGSGAKCCASSIQRFSWLSTAAGSVPVLCTPRSVPTANAAYNAAGNPFPVTSPR